MITSCLRYLRVHVPTVSLVGLLLACSALAQAAPDAAALPTNSVYQLHAQITDQAGRSFAIEEHRGQPMLVSMFYTSCQFVCPMLVEALRDTEAKLSPEERAHLHILLVSIDPAHDSVAVLQRVAHERELDPAHWTLARADAKTVRQLAATLGIQYRALANGEFNHTTAMILLDAEGRIAARTSQLGNADPAFVKRVKMATR